MQALLFRRVPNGEGQRLATDVWLPDGPGPFPVLLTRTPYHRRLGDAASARYYVERGYAYVIQDTRGKYDSEGTFRPLIDEAADGQATLDWIANQNWCNGRIGLVGKSYLGMVQIPAASGGHEALMCIVPGVAPTSFFLDWPRCDGCFSFANTVRWTLTHAVCPTTPSMAHFTWEELHSLRTLEEIEDRAGFHSPTLRDWVAHDRYDEYWEAVDQHRMFERVACPGMHVGGWFDHLTRGQFQSYRGIKQRGATQSARSGQRLIVGPWGHMTIGQREYGEWDFGRAAQINVSDYEQRFIDLHMKDIDDGISDEPPVYVFLMGENRWVHAADWPPPTAEVQEWYLRSDGDANGVGGGGRLSLESQDHAPPDRYCYDPQQPVPTLGGPIYWGIAPVGPVHQGPILGRADVLYYRSERLARPLTVMGEINLDLWVSSDAPDTDFTAKLCVVDSGGRVIVLAMGALRCRYRQGFHDPKPLTAGEATSVRLQMGNLAYVFPEGSAIALLITSSDFPRILPNPNTMAPTWQEKSPRVARQEIHHSGNHQSRLALPVVSG